MPGFTQDFTPRKRAARLALAFACAACAACSVEGRWVRVESGAKAVPLPIDSLTLGPSQRYSAVWSEDGEQRGSVGTYRWTGTTLKFTQQGGGTHDYGARLRLDGKLELSLSAGKHTARAVMQRERALPQPPQPAPAPAEPPAPTNEKSNP